MNTLPQLITFDITFNNIKFYKYSFIEAQQFISFCQYHSQNSLQSPPMIISRYFSIIHTGFEMIHISTVEDNNSDIIKFSQFRIYFICFSDFHSSRRSSLKCTTKLTYRSVDIMHEGSPWREHSMRNGNRFSPYLIYSMLFRLRRVHKTLKTITHKTQWLKKALNSIKGCCVVSFEDLRE